MKIQISVAMAEGFDCKYATDKEKEWSAPLLILTQHLYTALSHFLLAAGLLSVLNSLG